MTKSIIKAGKVALITGAGAGIGAAAARYFSERGMSLVLFDRDREALELVASGLAGDHLLLVGDVSSSEDLKELHDQTLSRFGKVNLLFNNAAVSDRGMPWDDKAKWQRLLDVNLLSVLELQHLFLADMLTQDEASAIVNLGSKEGITTPPGNAAYSVAKAGIKILTEQLAHALRQSPDYPVTAHLLIPGYTWTPMNFPDADFLRPDTKPVAPWAPEQVIAYFHQRFEAGDFYILCPDNEVTKEMDDRRMRWAVDDIIYNRPALARWHDDYKEMFAHWLAEGSLPDNEDFRHGS